MGAVFSWMPRKTQRLSTEMGIPNLNCHNVRRGDGAGEESVRGVCLLVHASLLLNAGGRLSGPCNGTLTSSSGHPAVPQQCFHFCPLHSSNTGWEWLHSESSSLKEKNLESIFCITGQTSLKFCQQNRFKESFFLKKKKELRMIITIYLWCSNTCKSHFIRCNAS